MSNHHVHEWRGQRAKLCACGVSPDDECRNGHPRSESYRNAAGKWCCRSCRRNSNADWRATAQTPEQRAAELEGNRTSARHRHQELRQQVLNHYGNACACCGEAIAAFLCIDHVNGDGSAHRATIKKKASSGGSAVTYRWIIKHGFPEGFQTLCHNCNYAKHVLGVCPHQEKRGNSG